MTDRVIVYDSALPQSTDILQTNKFAMIGLAVQAAAALGTNTVVNGLSCTPTSPTANLFVNVAPGSIYSMIQVDATAYGDLGIDTNTVMKQGILYTALALQITPPSTAGYSQVYLVQAEYVDQDTGTAVLPYFNANNPSQPFTGPGNSGSTSQFTIRQGLCNISLVAGIAMPTGTQVTPAPLFGNTGLFAVTVANGQTQITAPNIVTLTTAPFFPSLPAVPPGVQQNAWTYAIDTGTLNAMAATVWPIPAALVPGLVVQVKAANTNTSTVTLNVNGLGVTPVHRATGATLSAGDITIGQVVAFMYDGASWQILNFTGATSGSITNNFNSYAVPYAAATGTANALLATFSPSVGSLFAGLIVLVKASLSSTGAATITPLALATTPILENGLPLLPSAIVAGELLVLCYDGANFQKINCRNQVFAFNSSSPPASDIPMQIGDILTVTFSAVTSVPLKVASVPGIYDIEVVVTSQTGGGITDMDPYLWPNNVNTSGPHVFTTWVTENLSVGGGSGIFGSPITQSWDQSAYPSDPNLGTFNFDFFGDNLNSMPPGWNVAPMTFKMVCSTFTNAKMVRFWGGIQAGPAMGFCIWNDTSTTWTSLGTIKMGDDGAYASITGVATVRRLA